MSLDLLNHPDYDKYDTSTLKSLGGGGAAPPKKLSEQTAKAGKSAGQGWGLTESNALTVQTMSSAEYVKNPSSCGRPTSLIDVKIMDPDDPSKEIKIENLKKRYTLGKLKFNSVLIADFDESLKSVITSLLYSDVSPKEKYFITLNQWFDESLLNEKSSQPLYYPSINKKNLEAFEKKFFKKFNEKPNHISLLSYDLVGLIYYLSLKNNLSEIDKVFKSKNSFKGKIGIFEIDKNIITHKLNFYVIENKNIKKIF